MPHLRTWLTATLTVLVPGALMAAPLPVKIDRFEGEVVQVNGTIHSGVLPGKNLQAGTQVQTGPDGRAELSLNGATTVSVGGGTDLLVHSVESGVLRMRMASGALHVDTRAQGTKPARDVRLNVGDLRLRILEADAWTELGDRGGQVCLIAGVVEAQQPNSTLRLDTPGQCLRQSGLTSQWSMVPVGVLDDRVALVSVRETVAAAPKPAPQIKALPLPIEPEPAPTIVASEASPPPTPAAPAAGPPAAKAPPVIVLEKPVPVAAAPIAVAPPSNADTSAPQVAKIEAPAPAPIVVVPAPTAPAVAVEKPAVPAPGKAPAKPATKATESAATPAHVPPVIVIDKPVEPPAPVAKPAVAAAPAHTPAAVVIDKPAQVAVAEKPAAAPMTDPVVKGESVPLHPHVPPVIVIQGPASSENSSAPAPVKEALPAAVPPPVVEKLPEAPAPAGTVAMAFPAPAEVPALPEPPAVKPQPAKPAAGSSASPAPKTDAKTAAATPQKPAATAAAPPADAKSTTKSAAQFDTELAMAEPASSGADDGRRWRVVLGSMPEPEKADIEAERLNARGWAVEAREYRVGDRHGYRIGFGEFAERDQAQKALEEFLAQYPEATAWLAKY